MVTMPAAINEKTLMIEPIFVMSFGLNVERRHIYMFTAGLVAYVGRPVRTVSQANNNAKPWSYNTQRFAFVR
jgi:hypothetical protein